jgi:dTDP-4-dehydrorhamnose reductase
VLSAYAPVRARGLHRRAAMTNQSDGRGRAPLEMWGGIECTVNRVGDRYFEQILRSGHAFRVEDLDLVGETRVRALRYPVLWELHAPSESEPPNFWWSDERLERLRHLCIRPIVGLTHHGSGPRHTSLLDPRFGEKLAAYARRVAERYPWVTDYTPVNEPLTTARFSALYGHWYPHTKDEGSFLRALVNECRGTVLAMRAIRDVTPRARLVQTEDLGHIYSSEHLRYQADFENERRWLSLDLLCGRVDRDHPLWPRLLSWGFTEADAAWFRENACAPDILGINHYITSDRFLDEALWKYPEWSHGGNGRDRYADVEAVRASLECDISTENVVRQAWQRYGLPLAVTEAHLGSTREEQIRWLAEIWRGCVKLRDEGADVRAVTVWSMFGAFDWNTLVTRDNGFYEPGAFDVRAPSPRPTAIARVVHKLATTGDARGEPLVGLPGWWSRPDRLYHPLAHGRTPATTQTEPTVDMDVEHAGKLAARPLLILGATGTLGAAFARLCDARGIPYLAIGRKELDLTGGARADALLETTNAWAVVNAAGYVRVDDAESDRDACLTVNAHGPAALAAACARAAIPFVAFSSDLVFDGARRERPYDERDDARPLNVYGMSKLAMENDVLATHPRALVVRTSAFFGPWDEANFVFAALRALSSGKKFYAAEDAVVSPTYVPDLVHATLDLLIDGETGLWHLANVGAMSWFDLAQRAAEMARLPVDKVRRRPTHAMGYAAKRPLFSALASVRGWVLPKVEDALSRCVDALSRSPALVRAA